MVRADGDPTTAASVDFTVTFDESVTGVDVLSAGGFDDFSVNASGPTGATITAVVGSGTTYTVTVSTIAGDGTLGLNVLTAGSIVDGVSQAFVNGTPTGSNEV